MTTEIAVLVVVLLLASAAAGRFVLLKSGLLRKSVEDDCGCGKCAEKRRAGGPIRNYEVKKRLPETPETPKKP